MRFLLLMFLFVFSANAFATNNEEFIGWIKTQTPTNLAKFLSENTAKQLPIQIDSITVFMGVFSVGDTITMRIQIQKTKKDFIALLNENGKTLKSYIPEFNAMVHNMGCSQEVNKAQIEQGIKYKYIVSDLEFKKLFETYVKSCD